VVVKREVAGAAFGAQAAAQEAPSCEPQLNLRGPRLLQRWRVFEGVWHTHPMGEAKETKKTQLAQAGEGAMFVDTMGGRVHVRWVEDGLLRYSSPHASRAHDVLGTLMLDMDATIKPLYGRQARFSATPGAAPFWRNARSIEPPLARWRV
jgi:hypothetical protein